MICLLTSYTVQGNTVRSNARYGCCLRRLKTLSL